MLFRLQTVGCTLGCRMPHHWWLQKAPFLKGPSPKGTFDNVTHWKGKQVTDYAKKEVLPQLLPNIVFLGMSIVVFVVFILWWVGAVVRQRPNIQANTNKAHGIQSEHSVASRFLPCSRHVCNAKFAGLDFCLRKRPPYPVRLRPVRDPCAGACCAAAASAAA